MKWRILAIVALFFCAAAPAAAQGSPKFFLNTSTRTDQPKNSHVAAIADWLQTQTRKAITRKLPCASTLTMDDATTLLGHARARELLGNGDPNALQAIAGGVGARYIVSISVIQLGPRYSLGVTLTDANTARATARNAIFVDASKGEDAALDAAEGLASTFAGSISSPKCPGGVWTGSVTIVDKGEMKGSGSDGAWTLGHTEEVTCQVAGTRADCTVHYRQYGIQAKGSWENKKDGKGETLFGVSESAGKARIHMATVDALGTNSISGKGKTLSYENVKFQSDGFDVEAVSSTPGKLSGKWSNNRGRTVEWNLWR